MKTGTKLGIMLSVWVINVLIYLSIIVGATYVVVHFIKKVW